ncbi:hypothetical protein [Micropruina sp.]|uniref:hypothetical protein n=1 Tax=Micropruina sp. TaxID=2737536 RepID=UPI0039E4976B
MVAQLLSGFDSSLFDGRSLAERSSAEQERTALDVRDRFADRAAATRDLVAHCSGRPDLLLRDPGGGYHPAEIKIAPRQRPRGGGSTLTWSALSESSRGTRLHGGTRLHRLSDRVPIPLGVSGETWP